MISSMPHFPMALDISSPVRPAVLGPDLEARGLGEEWKGRAHTSSRQPGHLAGEHLYLSGPPSFLPPLHSSCFILLSLGPQTPTTTPKAAFPIQHPWVVTRTCHSSVFLTLHLWFFPRNPHTLNDQRIVYVVKPSDWDS